MRGQLLAHTHQADPVHLKHDHHDVDHVDDDGGDDDDDDHDDHDDQPTSTIWSLTRMRPSQPATESSTTRFT